MFPDGDHRGEELDQFLGVGLRGEVEVQALVVGLYTNTILNENIYSFLYFQNIYLAGSGSVIFSCGSNSRYLSKWFHKLNMAVFF